jgi:L-amino acid N-acyltransferase YncA/protein-tyrosine-phosphatase
MKIKVAFICVHNSCRSQMAEAISKIIASDEFEAFSAGTETKSQINQDAVAVIKEIYGVDMSATQKPKLLSEIPPVDVVITMGCNVKCPYLPCRYREDWGLEDPTGKDKNEFIKTAQKIEERVMELKNRINMKYKIEEMKSSDWDQVRDIYLEGIKTGIATFQTEAPNFDDWNKSHLESCRLVACLENDILGWAALSPTSSRACYSGVVEVSLYVSKKYRGQGIGTALLNEIIKLSEENGIWTLYCSIIRENVTSIAMCKKCGFREIGIREKIAKMGNGVWYDTILMERRSKVTGLI